MSSTRFWIVLLAVTSFLAGMAGGVLAGIHVAPKAVERGPYDDYAAILAATYDIPPERERHLRAFLERYHRDLEDLKDRHVADAEAELIRLGEICRQRIRDYVLTETDRASFDRVARDLVTQDSLSWPATPDQGE
jgi:hypothetical protein